MPGEMMSYSAKRCRGDRIDRIRLACCVYCGQWQCRISNVANVAYATVLAILGASRHRKLKRIKDAQRSTVNQNRLNDLILTSMEYELLRS